MKKVLTPVERQLERLIWQGQMISRINTATVQPSLLCISLPSTQMANPNLFSVCC